MPSSQLTLSDEDRATLEYWTRCSTLSAGHRERRGSCSRSPTGGYLVHLPALGVSRPTVIKWRDRFATRGLVGLDDEPRSGRPKTIDDAQIIAATLEAPPASLAVTHWSSRLLGRHLGIGDATVARAWRAYRVQPWRSGTFKFSTDPELEAKVCDVVGLYLNPPEHAIVLCIDEKSQIQALNRTQPILPVRPLPSSRWAPAARTSAASTPTVRAAKLQFAPAVAEDDREWVLAAIDKVRPEARQLIDDIDGMVTITTYSEPDGGTVGLMRQTAPDAYEVSFNVAYLDRERKLDRDSTVAHELAHVIDAARRHRPSCATGSRRRSPSAAAACTPRPATARRPRSASPTRSPSGRCAARCPSPAPATASRRPRRSRTGAPRWPPSRSRSKSRRGRPHARRAGRRRAARRA